MAREMTPEEHDSLWQPCPTPMEDALEHLWVSLYPSESELVKGDVLGKYWPDFLEIPYGWTRWGRNIIRPVTRGGHFPDDLVPEFLLRWLR